MTAAFDLGAMLGTPAPLRNEVKQIPCDMLIPYHNHKFTLYEGERLDDMVESIRTNGVLIPIIVQPVSGGKYEILIGHNRWNASRLAGLPTVPAVIKEGLTEDEAEMYVIESNLLQRSFSEMKISEQAAVIAMRHSAMFSQGKRNDIIRELSQLENPDSEPIITDSIADVGTEYGLGRTTVARLLRIDKLNEDIKPYIDSGRLSLRAAVELSYTSHKAQESISRLIDSYRIDEKKAHLIRENGAETEDGIIRLLTVEVKPPKPKSYKLNGERFGHFFEEGTKPDEIEDIIERALTAYFGEQQSLEG